MLQAVSKDTMDISRENNRKTQKNSNLRQDVKEKTLKMKTKKQQNNSETKEEEYNYPDFCGHYLLLMYQVYWTMLFKLYMILLKNS